MSPITSAAMRAPTILRAALMGSCVVMEAPQAFEALGTGTRAMC